MTRLALLAAALVLAAAPAAAWPFSKPAPAAEQPRQCQTQPQWITNDAQGRPANAIYVCFRADHVLEWTARPLSFDEILKLVIPPAPAAAPVAAKPADAAPAPVAKSEPKAEAPAAPAATPQPPVTPSASTALATAPAPVAVPPVVVANPASTPAPAAAQAPK